MVSSAWEPLFALVLGSCIVLPLLGLLSFHLPKSLILPSSFITLVGETKTVPPLKTPDRSRHFALLILGYLGSASGKRIRSHNPTHEEMPSHDQGGSTRYR
jgi:hypothetical protein